MDHLRPLAALQKFFQQFLGYCHCRRPCLSYDFPWLLGQKGATARHAIYGGQWRRLDRKQLGLPGPLRSMINRRLHHRA